METRSDEGRKLSTLFWKIPPFSRWRINAILYTVYQSLYYFSLKKNKQHSRFQGRSILLYSERKQKMLWGIFCPTALCLISPLCNGRKQPYFTNHYFFVATQGDYKFKRLFRMKYSNHYNALTYVYISCIIWIMFYTQNNYYFWAKYGTWY